jgi:outer membrane murein-binding lipoprotein Lpp
VTAHYPFPPESPPVEKPVNTSLLYPLIVAAIIGMVGVAIRGELTASKVHVLEDIAKVSQVSQVKVAVLEAQLTGISTDVTELKTDVKALTFSVNTLANEVRSQPSKEK